MRYDQIGSSDGSDRQGRQACEGYAGPRKCSPGELSRECAVASVEDRELAMQAGPAAWYDKVACPDVLTIIGSQADARGGTSARRDT